MKRVLLTIVALLLVAGVVVAGLAATKPDTYTVTRTAVVAAPPESVFAQVDDFRRWAAWSPWEKLDPAMQKTFEGPESGVGSSYAWSGNSQVGVGKMTITESVPPEHVGLRLEFIKPFASVSQTRFAFAPAPGGTQVTWEMEGRHNFVSKCMCVFMDMDKMVGKDFESGLANLDQVARSMPAAAPADTAAAAH